MDKEKDDAFTLLKEDSFTFRCHPGIECFTKCCADLQLVLTPYDIIRLKNRLRISSGDFLERYTDTRIDGRSRFPKVFLAMNPDKSKQCPFLEPSGCAVYEDRPGACRIYPLGRAALKVDKGNRAREKYFMVREPHCMGFKESRRWTIKEWLSREGVEEYNAMNDRWLEIITARKSLGKEDCFAQKMQMFSMASYNIDKFRAFVFESRFLDLIEVSPGVREKIKFDDLALMRFAMDWIEFSLFGEKTMKPIQPQARRRKERIWETGEEDAEDEG